MILKIASKLSSQRNVVENLLSLTSTSLSPNKKFKSGKKGSKAVNELMEGRLVMKTNRS